MKISYADVSFFPLAFSIGIRLLGVNHFLASDTWIGYALFILFTGIALTASFTKWYSGWFESEAWKSRISTGLSALGCVLANLLYWLAYTTALDLNSDKALLLRLVGIPGVLLAMFISTRYLPRLPRW